MKLHKANADIRKMIKDSPVYAYNVAEELGYSDNYFLALLRHPLSADKKQEVKKALADAVKKAQKAGALA